MLVRIPIPFPSFKGINLGGIAVRGVNEEGLFGSHNWDGQKARWTNGHGRWDIPLNEGETPSRLILKIVSSGPGGAEISIIINGESLLSQNLPRGAWETEISLKNIKTDNMMTVQLESSVFVPAQRDANSSDNRQLGVAVTTLIVE